MPDIFISYSRKDSEQALSLAERLRNEGMSVWIDQQGIEAAKTWSEEIVNAIEGSKAFVLLLSKHSVQSDHVARELSLAFDGKRPLVPVSLDDIELTPKFKYPLAGIQRVAYQQFSAIMSALVACGITPDATPQVIAPPKKKDNRKSLLIMPFEDLSPTQDNLWFADGLAGELIDKLAHVKSLRLVDRRTARELRAAKLGVYESSKMVDAHYVIEGTVRKFGDQVKISISLLDVVEGEYLWQESHKGVMNDVFELQEHVSHRVVAALHVKLRNDEAEAIGRKETVSSEAFELMMRAEERGLVEDFDASVQLLEQAVALDANYERAWANLAIQCLNHFTFSRDEKIRDRAVEAIECLRKARGETAMWYGVKARAAHHFGDLEGAETWSKKAIELKADFPDPYLQIALTKSYELKFDEAVLYLERAIDLGMRRAHTTYILAANAYNKLGRSADAARMAQAGLADLEIRIRIQPTMLEQPGVRTLRAIFNTYLGNADAARADLDILRDLNYRRPDEIVNAASALALNGRTEDALHVLRNGKILTSHMIELMLKDSDLARLHSLPEFQQIVADHRARLAIAEQPTANA